MKYHKNLQLESILETPKCLINKPDGTDNILRQVCKNITPAKTIMQEKRSLFTYVEESTKT